MAHYLLAVIEQLERDTARLGAAYESTNRNPLGACAITGTGFPIDRNRTSELLGFSGPTCNTYGSIATVDYLLESVSATSILIVGLGRVVQDFLLWCTMEFGYLRLSDGFVQGSSIMPQKRNPVALEHARAIGSKTVGQAQAITTAIHNTPFGDIVDTEDDLQPLVASMFNDAIRMVTLVAAAMKLADFNVERLAARAAHGGTTLTELADTLVRDHGLPFRSAHGIAALLLKAQTEDPERAAVERAGEGVHGDPGAPAELHRGRAADHHEPGALREGADDVGRPRAERDRARDRRVACAARRRPRELDEAPGRPGPRRSHEARAGEEAVSAMRRNYIRVAIVWVITLAALYTFQSYFTR